MLLTVYTKHRTAQKSDTGSQVTHDRARCQTPHLLLESSTNRLLGYNNPTFLCDCWSYLTVIILLCLLFTGWLCLGVYFYWSSKNELLTLNPLFNTFILWCFYSVKSSINKGINVFVFLILLFIIDIFGTFLTWMTSAW